MAQKLYEKSDNKQESYSRKLVARFIVHGVVGEI